MTETKPDEIQRAIDNGDDETEMVRNIPPFKNRVRLAQKSKSQTCT